MTETPFRGRRPRGGETRTGRPLSAAVLPSERERILRALAQAGFNHPSHGIRTILLAYAGSVTVRDSVAAEHEIRRAAA